MFGTRSNPVRRNRRLVALNARQSFEAEQFRRLRQRIEDLTISRGVRAVAITSAAPSEGKTTTAVNLAVTLAQAPQARVLLVDADLRRPTVAPTLGLPREEGGLLALLADGGRDVESHVHRVSGTTLDVLPCEEARGNTYDVLRSPALQTLFARAREVYSLVVVDSPPVVPVPDSNLLKQFVDGYLVVLSANQTPRRLLAEALNLLDPSSVLGLVFNRDVRPLFGHYSAYYDAYFREPSSHGHPVEI
jgi:capsular exopolysaccharide synthesis family protein